MAERQKYLMRRCITTVVVLSLTSTIAQAESPKPGVQPSVEHVEFYQQKLQPLVSKYCLACHQGSDPKSGLRLDQFGTLDAAAKDSETWHRVLKMLRDRSMPPPGSPKPSEDETRAAVLWLQAMLQSVDRAQAANGNRGDGHVTIRRLNRAEYTNTIRDLLGVKFNALETFPADDVGNGFDNIGDVLTLPPFLLEKYFAAAEKISQQALALNDGKAKPAERPEQYQRLFVARPDRYTSDDSATRQIIRHLISRAYRHPANEKDVERLSRLAKAARDQGASFESSVQQMLMAVLVSPKFLFRIEAEFRGRGSKTEASKTGPVSEYDLASRLSYFLWSSMPDESLFKQAASISLRANLKSEVKRMLANNKMQAFVQNFAGQWLQLRNLERSMPNREEFPDFNDDLRRDMRTETEMFFLAIVREDRSVLDFIDADFTFVNARLAKHYGIAGVQGDTFRRISLKETAATSVVMLRGGILTQASILTVTSNPTRTSPVKRGKWIMENILGTPPPDPPPDVPVLSDDSQATASASLRERMEIHRKKAECAVCHSAMDPLGFALQNFDAVGAWRTRDGKFPIDASGQLPGGETFNGPEGLKKLLKNDEKEKFARCLAEKMLTYALGRGLETYDRAAVDGIVSSLEKNDYRFSALVFAVVESDPFQQRP
jgi:hypothetical protein